MTLPPRNGLADPKTATSDRSLTVGLLVVCAVALGLRLYSSAHIDLDHNGAWHVFIAKNLSREWKTPAHPPLFLVLLKVCDMMSHSLLAYRAVPILAGVGGVFLVGRVLSKLGTLPNVAVLGALTLACAQTASVLSVLVESYTVALLFILAAFFFALDLIGGGAPPPVRSRWGFTLFSTLAVLSHYFTALFLAALAMAVVIAAAIRPEYRRSLLRSLPGRWKADLLTLAPPALAGAAVYWILLRQWMTLTLSHVPSFTFDRARESLGGFLALGMTRTFNLFAPVEISRVGLAVAVLGLFLAVVILAPATERLSGAWNAARMIPALSLLSLFLLGGVLGVIRRYPFGGAMRHQFLFLLFALLAGFVAFDRWMRSCSPKGRTVLAVLAVGIIGADVVVNRRGYTTHSFEALEVQRGIFRHHLASARTVHLDRFHVVGLMMEYYRWDWRYEGSDPSNPTVRRYVLSLDGKDLTVVAHWQWWLFDFLDPALYAELAKAWDRGLGESQVVFALSQNRYLITRKLEPKRRTELETRIPVLARAEGLEVRRLALDDDDVYAELRLRSGPTSLSSRDRMPGP